MKRTLLFLAVFVLLGIVLNVWYYKTLPSKSVTPEPEKEQQIQGESKSEETH